MPDRELSAKYPTDLSSWKALKTHYRDEMKAKSLGDLFQRNQERFSGYSLEAGDLFLDYSKNFLNSKTRKLLVKLATEAGVPECSQKIGRADALYRGD